MLNPKNISQLGIGSWGLGGLMERDSSIDKNKQIDALIYMLNKGLNFIEVNAWYSQGASVEIIAKAIKESGIKREEIFVCQAIYLKDGKDFVMGKKEFELATQHLETNYIDTLQFSSVSFNIASFDEISNWIEGLIENKKIRYTSITNADLDLLKRYHARFGANLFSHEVVFNFEVRDNESLGIIPYGIENGIKTVVYQPLRRNRTALRNWEPIVKLAKKYGKSQNQIILNWIVGKGYLPLTKSETISHIDEHLEALNFKMETNDIELLNNFTIPGFVSPVIDWNKSGNGYSIDQLSNVFDDLYDKAKGH